MILLTRITLMVTGLLMVSLVKKGKMEMNKYQKVTSEWIPVSDRLPEEYESVLFSTNFGDVLVGFLTSSKQWTVESTGYPYVEYGVLAWMPLPEPYVPDICVGNKKGAER